MKRLLKFFINLIFKCFPIKNNRIIFITREDKIEDNPLAIFEYLSKYYESKYELIWISNKKIDLEEYRDINFYNGRSLRGLYYRATSRYWIASIAVEGIIKKRKNQIFIQLWHSIGAFKKMGYDTNDFSCENRVTMPHVRNWDYFIASDKYAARAMKSATEYKNRVEVLGSARTDKLVNLDKSKVQHIKQKLNIPENKTVILYAPTFRDNDLSNKRLELKLNFLPDKDNFIVLIRLHPWVQHLRNNIDKTDKRYKDVTYYDDCNDLLLISDVLITDYSSIIFDFNILDRPMIFFPYDYDDYIKYRGDFYLDYKRDLPGPIVYDEDIVKLEIIKMYNKLDTYKNERFKFNNKYNYLNDGCVCERFCKLFNDNYFANF